ncbi:MAG: YkgJ family cysteine cluster protein [Planctomycetes bacterium]|nr:YkgJ family cysteine cluster protein [Planctomycetota bacterium]
MSGWIKATRWRLTHQEDGSCIFLDERGFCRIHSKFGEAAKPLACRIYPYAFHPAGKSVVVSLRFSCPSVVKNLGTAVVEQAAEIRRLAQDVLPRERQPGNPPPLHHNEITTWNDFLQFVQALDQSVSDSSVPLILRLLRTCFWVGLVGQSTFQKLQGSRITDFLSLVTEASTAEIPSIPENVEEPSLLGKLYFRLLVAQYARKDTAADLSLGLLGRFRLARMIWAFSKGTGTTPRIQDIFQSIPFELIENPVGVLNEEQERILTRFLRVKIQGIHFCGPAFYEYSYVEGFQSLALCVVSILWIARWLMLSSSRSSLSTDDIVTAITIADHHHGYSPTLGQSASRQRARTLSSTGDLQRLLIRYSR